MVLYNKGGDKVSSTLTYCEKCGHIGDLLFWNPEDKGCFACNAKGVTKLVPEEYLNEGGWGINKNLEEEFIVNFVKSSPNFDQTCWDRRESFKETQKHNNELLVNDKINQSNVPKCLTCSSTNIQRIGTGERVTSVAMLGIFSKKINKSFRCKNCGYTW